MRCDDGNFKQALPPKENKTNAKARRKQSMNGVGFKRDFLIESRMNNGRSFQFVSVWWIHYVWWNIHRSLSIISHLEFAGEGRVDRWVGMGRALWGIGGGGRCGGGQSDCEPNDNETLTGRAEVRSSGRWHLGGGRPGCAVSPPWRTSPRPRWCVPGSSRAVYPSPWTRQPAFPLSLSLSLSLFLPPSPVSIRSVRLGVSGTGRPTRGRRTHSAPSTAAPPAATRRELSNNQKQPDGWLLLVLFLFGSLLVFVTLCSFICFFWTDFPQLMPSLHSFPLFFLSFFLFLFCFRLESGSGRVERTRHFNSTDLIMIYCFTGFHHYDRNQWKIIYIHQKTTKQQNK